ncbi:MAG: ABC transporter ATP-binding protein [Tepidisphaeraceae bacterium]|jgi:iron complex transport system ATP-binding protein
MANLLEAADVSFAYGDTPALRGVGVTLAPAQVAALIGPNGSGKSTLLLALLGHLPATGKIEWEGTPVRRHRRKDLARLVAYLPQSPRYEPGQTVLDVLRLGRAAYWGAFGLESFEDESVVSEVAQMLELENLLDRPVDRMSGGQRQRVMIGRCLTQQPKALLLDEPTTFLDLKHQVDLCQLLRRLATEKHLAVLMASHELNVAAASADHLTLLNAGKIDAAGKPDEVLRPEVLSPVYGVPIQRFEGATGPIVVPQSAQKI